ncbi:MAG: cob(I)yrinic acid a,c-diamide adenosyltransferase [Gallionellaceae bacterium]|nr:MAG: cob(I)yrinic acid a,c-diamide adenosyltransferase [Gallionellaceae bacterium]
MRLGKITTRTGDDGSTGLADGSRIAKDSARICAIGMLDELNSHIGVLLAEPVPENIRAELLRIQNDLFDLGGALASPASLFSDASLTRLDAAIAHYNAALPPLKEFILPGGTRAAALCHVARTVARRAERDLVQLMRNEALPGNGLLYLNRLSDLLFILSRSINKAANQPEAQWQRDTP